MVRRVRIRSVAFGIVVLIVSHSFLQGRAPAFGQEVSKDAKASLKERDRLWDQTRKLHAVGKSAEATAAAEAMLAIERRVLSAGHADLAVSLNWLAKMYSEREDFAAAKVAQREALAVLSKRYGETHWKVTDARLALEDIERKSKLNRVERQELTEAGRLYQVVDSLHRAGKDGEALKSARRALVLQNEVLGERHRDYADSQNWIAFLLELQGEHTRARPIYEKVMAIRKEVLGERHPDYATSLNNLAAQLYAQGDYAAARPLCEKALAIRKEVLGDHHLDYAASLNDLAALLNAQGDNAAARPLYEKALAIRKEVLGEHHAHYAASLNNLALLLQAQGDYASARAFFEKALAIRKDALSERHPDYATSLNNLACLLESQRDYAGARPLYEKALAIRKEVLGERHPDYATSLNNLARLLELQGEYAGARPLYGKALAIRKEVLGDHHAHYAASLNNLACLLELQGDYAAARPLYEQVLAINKEVLGERHPDYATSLNNLAELLRVQGDYAASRPLYAKALAIRKAVQGERHPDYADSLNNLAMLLDSQGDYAAARPLYEKALAIRKEVCGERHPDCADSLNNLAGLLDSQGDYAAARPLYEQALAINKEVLGERHPKYATSLNNLAELLKSLGDYAAARPLYAKALAIRKAVQGERHPDYADSLNNLALLLDSQGDNTAARPLYEKALEIHKEALGERHPKYATSLNNLAELLKSLGDYAAARPLMEKALAIRREVLGERHPDCADSLNNLAALLRAQGDYAVARPLYEQALAIRKGALGERHHKYAASLNNLAELLMSQGDYAAARPLYEKALAIYKEVLGERHPHSATSLINLGCILWAQGDYARAASLVKQALEIAQGNLDLAAAAQSERQQLAMANELRGNLDAYLSLAPRAQLAPREAYHHVLASKGAVFDRQRRLRVQRRRLQTDPRSQAGRLFAEYEQTVKQLATLALTTPNPKQAQAWREKLGDLARRKDELEAELARLDAEFRAVKAEASRTPEQLQGALPPGAAVVDLLVYTAGQPSALAKGDFQTERSLVAFVVRPDRPIARIDLGPIAPILRAIEEWRPILIGGNTTPAGSDPAQTLRRLIWKPVEPHLDGVSSVLVSPDGSLGQIPLAALPGKEPNSYLIEAWSISVVPVPRMLAATAARAQNGDVAHNAAASLLLAGDINYGGEAGTGGELALKRSAATPTRAGLLADFKSLPETRIEILAVRDSFEERFPDARAQVLRGDNATEEAIRQKAPRSRYLHLATHGYFAPKELRSALGPDDQKAKRPWIDALGGAGVTGYHPGLLSGIALAGANIRPTPIGHDDGILTALEVAELDLSGVELAVLSACETGFGEVAGGEGLLGLQRAFQVAGAHSVIASLWTIGDEPTRALMARFYENLWRKGLPPARALREAQLSMLRGDLGRGSLKREAEGPKSDRLPPSYWAAFVLSTDQP